MAKDEQACPPEVNLNGSSNPYEDDTLTESQPELPEPVPRDPFNDVVKHGDIVQGFRRNRTLSDYPKKARPWVRIYAIAVLVVFVVGLVWDLVRF